MIVLNMRKYFNIEAKDLQSMTNIHNTAIQSVIKSSVYEKHIRVLRAIRRRSTIRVLRAIRRRSTWSMSFKRRLRRRSSIRILRRRTWSTSLKTRLRRRSSIRILLTTNKKPWRRWRRWRAWPNWGESLRNAAAKKAMKTARDRSSG